MTYQRNMRESLLPQEDVLDDALEDEIGAVEEHADDQTGDQHHDDALDELVLPGPLDLLQLTPRLGDEASDAAARNVALRSATVSGRRGSRRTRRRRLCSARPLDLRAVARRLGPPRAALGCRLA